MFFLCGGIAFGLGAFLGYAKGWGSGFDRCDKITNEFRADWAKMEEAATKEVR